MSCTVSDPAQVGRNDYSADQQAVVSSDSSAMEEDDLCDDSRFKIFYASEALINELGGIHACLVVLSRLNQLRDG